MSRLHALFAGVAPTRRRQVGFTIIELMLAVAIVAVLVGIAMPAYQNYRERARINQAKTDIAAMSALIANAYQDLKAYPDSLDQVGLGGMRDPWGNPYGYLNLGDKK